MCWRVLRVHASLTKLTLLLEFDAAFFIYGAGLQRAATSSGQNVVDLLCLTTHFLKFSTVNCFDQIDINWSAGTQWIFFPLHMTFTICKLVIVQISHCHPFVTFTAAKSYFPYSGNTATCSLPPWRLVKFCETTTPVCRRLSSVCSSFVFLKDARLRCSLQFEESDVCGRTVTAVL